MKGYLKRLGADIMRILGLFSKYFLALMLIQGFVLAFIDSKSFKRACMKRTANKAKIMGLGSIIISIILYLFAMYAV